MLAIIELIDFVPTFESNNFVHVAITVINLNANTSFSFLVIYIKFEFKQGKQQQQRPLRLVKKSYNSNRK